jgi:hypothetical protein
VNEERILDKLDGLEHKTTDILVGMARIEEQIKDVPNLKDRVAALERWRWTAMGALGAAGASLLSQVYNAVKGA